MLCEYEFTCFFPILLANLLQGSFRLFVTVMDNSGDDDELIQKLSIDEETSVNDEGFTPETSYDGLGCGGKLTASFQVTCAPNHFGTDCSTFCKNGTGDNFVCDKNGARVCLSGWTHPDQYCQTCKPASLHISINGKVFMLAMVNSAARITWSTEE